MSSSVSYITSGKDFSQTTVKESTSSLSFSLNPLPKDQRVDLGSGNTPVIGKARSVDYSTSGKISDKFNLSEVVEKLNKTLAIENTSDTVDKMFVKNSTKYNRFKIATPNTALQKGFGHVFFVRPDCNIFSGNGKNTLRNSLQIKEMFNYTWKKSPNVLKELVSVNNTDNDFMMSLSNAATNFSLSDEYINADTYGRTFRGHKVAYGKNNIESKTSGEFSITFNDDRNLNIYQIHRLWVEYINGVYLGEIEPSIDSIYNKILDYTAACYYILTAEDGETILFWSKYYGVFPTTVPSTQFSWGAGNVINNPQLEIQYKFSFKEDFNPYTLLEFNYNARINANGKTTTYVPVYDKKLDHVGTTWVGSPFIELERDGEAGIYNYKLRFREK